MISADENSRTTKSGDKPGFGTHVSDTFTLALEGSNSAVVTGTHTTSASLVNALANKWLANNSTANLRRWDVDSTTDSEKIRFTARDQGTSQIGKRVNLYCFHSFTN